MPNTRKDFNKPLLILSNSITLKIIDLLSAQIGHIGGDIQIRSSFSSGVEIINVFNAS